MESTMEGLDYYNCKNNKQFYNLGISSDVIRMLLNMEKHFTPIQWKLIVDLAVNNPVDFCDQFNLEYIKVLRFIFKKSFLC